MFSNEHPGALIKKTIVNDFNLSVKDAANLLGVTRENLSMLLNSHIDLSTAMAFKIEKVFGVPMELLLDIQMKYSIRRERSKVDVGLKAFTLKT